MPKKTKEKPRVEAKPAKPSNDKDENILGVICYLLGVLALILYYVKKESKFVRFHAMQSALLNVVWLAVFIVLVGISMVLMIITIPLGGIGGMVYLCVLPLGLVAIAATVFGAWKAYQGEMYKMPFIGDYADKYS
ncbi:MAG: DUF4870 domain-containing protein [Candidatus Micrarchaeota archaeon]|nr:DUF4870 domain-containing protein [Candidatus Micrarchaeota archaeon]